MNQFSKIVDSLRFPLIVLVVFIHCSGQYSYTISDIEWDNFRVIDSFVLFRFMVVDIICRVAVPCFFLFSGYYFFYNVKSFNTTVYRSKIIKRIKTLFIPYVLWNTIQFAVSACLIVKSTWKSGSVPALTKLYDDFGGLIGIFWNGNISTTSHNYLGFIDGRTAPADMPLWFLRDLMVVSLLSPIIYKLIQLLGKYYVVLLFIIYILCLWPWIPGFSIESLSYFSLGAHLSLKNVDCINLKKKYHVCLITLSIFMIPILVLNYKQTLLNLQPVFILCAIATVFSLLSSPSKNIQRIQNYLIKLKPTVFFIFAIHFTPIVAFLPSFFERYYSSDNLILNMILSLLIPLSCVLLSLFYYSITKLFSKRLLNLLIGR